MARGLKRCPDALYANQNLMKKIRDNWKHHFKYGEEVWLLDRTWREVLGPFKFSYYSPASAVVLFEHQGHFGTRRVYFLKDQVMYQTKEEANSSLVALKVLDYLTLQSKADVLLDEIEAIADKSIVETVRKVRNYHE